jgi:proteasome-associated ATPase
VSDANRPDRSLGAHPEPTVKPEDVVEQRNPATGTAKDNPAVLQEALRSVRVLEERLQEARSQTTQAISQNERLVETLKEAKEQIIGLKEEVERLTAPPSGFGVFLGKNSDETINVSSGGRKLRVNVHPSIDLDSLRYGQELMLNEALNVVEACSFEIQGEIVTVTRVLDSERALVKGNADEDRIVQLGEPLRTLQIRPGDALLLDVRSGFVLEHIPTPEVGELLVEEISDVSFDHIGGLRTQIDQIRDIVELPLLHPEVVARYELVPPKGILLYGPPGCGKTLIAKALANALAETTHLSKGGSSVGNFLYIKGPELLNKYVGEGEKQVRSIFGRARERAALGSPVIVFFDEMDGSFRTRGSTFNDAESTMVGQLLSELDGMQPLTGVVVLAATNREDMIDPAILRPGRFDAKIRIERPDAQDAKEIFAQYLRSSLPISPDLLRSTRGDPKLAVGELIRKTVEYMYAEGETNRFVEVTYMNGEREVLYFKDFSSGAMIKNIVTRAKKMAVKRFLSSGQDGLSLSDLYAAVDEEFAESEDFPNSGHPDDWARVSGKKGERIAYLRTLKGVSLDSGPGLLGR